MSANIALIRTELEALAMGGVKDAAAAERLNKRREGTYTHGVKAAIAADGDSKAFLKVCEGLMEEIRVNKDGIAQAMKAKVAKKTGEDGSKRYTVPGALSSAKTYLSQAIDHSVSLVDAEDGETPRPYSQIRKDVDEARALAARESESVEDTQRREIAERCELITERASKLDGESLSQLHGAVTALYDALNGVQEAEEKASKALEAAAQSVEASEDADAPAQGKGSKAKAA